MFSVQVYAVKLRLHVAVVGDQITVATKPEVLRQVIDGSESAAAPHADHGALALAAQPQGAGPRL